MFPIESPRRKALSGIWRTAVFSWVSLLLAAPSYAADPAKTFEELFGSDAKKASTSRNTKDAADFAVKMLETARKVGDDLSFREYLLNKVCEFAMKDPSGFATAVQAAETLIADFEAKKDFYAEKLLGLYQAQYEKAKTSEKVPTGEEYVNKLLIRGDELLEPVQPAGAATGPASLPAGPDINVEAINAAMKLYKQAQIVANAVRSPMAAQVAQKISEANARIDLKKRYDELAAKIAARPDDSATARALTLLCLLELDDPALASRYSAAGGDEGLKIYVPLAAKPIADIQESLCMELAGWYKSLAGGASNKQSRITAYIRCKSYISQFMALHSRADTEQLRAQKMLDETGAELAKLDPAGTGGASSKAIRLNLPQKAGIIWEYEMEPPSTIDRILLSPDCRSLAVSNRKGIVIFDTETRKKVFECDNWTPGEAFSSDSKIIMLVSNPLSAFEIKTGKPLIKDARHMMANHLPCISPDGKFVFGFLNHPKTLDVLDFQTGKKVKEIALEAKGNIRAPGAALSPDGKQVLVTYIDEGETAGKQRFCRIFDLTSDKPVLSLPCFQETDFGSFRVSYLADGKRAVGYKQGTGIAIWDIRNGKVLAEFKKAAEAIGFTPDGRKLAFAAGKKVEVVDAATGKTIVEHKIIDGKDDIYFHNGASFTADGQYLFCGFIDWGAGGAVKKSGVYLIGIGR